MARAVADAVAAPVEGGERHEHRARGGPRARPAAARSGRSRRASACPRAPNGGTSRPWRSTRGRASVQPAPGEQPHQRARVDLAADRPGTRRRRRAADPATRHARAMSWETVRAAAPAHRAAPGRRLAARLRRRGLACFEARPCREAAWPSGCHEKCGATVAVGRSIPGNLQRRWAPFAQVHGQGQGQLPLGSIRPRGFIVLTHPAAPQPRLGRRARNCQPCRGRARLSRAARGRARRRHGLDALRRLEDGAGDVRLRRGRARLRSARARRAELARPRLPAQAMRERSSSPLVEEGDGGHHGEAVVADLAERLAHLARSWRRPRRRGGAGAPPARRRRRCGRPSRRW